MKRDDTKKKLTSLSGNDLKTVPLHYPSFPCIVAIVTISEVFCLIHYHSVLNVEFYLFCFENQETSKKGNCCFSVIKICSLKNNPYICKKSRNDMTAPEIAIIDSNTLSCLGLQNLLEEIIPMAVIRVFSSFEGLMDDTPDMYAHYFVSAQIYFGHTAFFLPRKPKTIVLANGDNQPQLVGIPTLNIYQDEKSLIRSILQLHQFGHREGHPHDHPQTVTNQSANTQYAEHDLSPREIEVLVLVTKGLINKEIADKLHISLTTVISHRKNITEKLGIKSVAGLTIYAVMHGYVEADCI